MKRTVTTLYWVVFLAGWLVAQSACAQKATVAGTPVPTPSDTIFIEIQLSSEGVDAIDTAGNHWTYDFERQSFVPDRTGSGRAGRPGEGRRAEATSRPAEERCTQEKFVKPLQGSVLIGYDEFVAGGFTAYGRVTIKGWVKGDIQSISGQVLVTESGRVDGDIKAPKIEVKEGAIVFGKQQITDPLDFPSEVLQRSFSVDGLVIVIAFIILLLVIAFLVTTLFPSQLLTMSSCMFEYKARSVFVGVLFLFLLPLILLLVAITIIGIAVVPFIPMAYLLAMACGVVILGGRIGAGISGKVLGGSQNRVIHALIGVPIFMLIWVLVAILLGSSHEVAQGFGIFFLVVSIIISLFPILGGIGAAVLTRFGYRSHQGTRVDRRRQATEAPAPAPPPIPDIPRLVTPPPAPPQNFSDDKFGPYGPTPRPPQPPGS